MEQLEFVVVDPADVPAVDLYTAYYRPAKLVPRMSEESDVETAGYRSVKTMVEEMVQAGKRLVAHRAGYEFPADQDVPEDYDDPLRAPGVDRFEVADRMRSLARRLAAQRRQAELAKAQRAKEAATPSPQKERAERAGPRWGRAGSGTGKSAEIEVLGLYNRSRCCIGPYLATGPLIEEMI